MNEYICNECGAEFWGLSNIEDVECPECYTMDCQLAYLIIEDEKEKTQ